MTEDLLSGENENGFYFPPYLKKQAPWCIFEGLGPYSCPTRSLPSVQEVCMAGQSGLGF